jgi:hypothetical protein
MKRERTIKIINGEDEKGNCIKMANEEDEKEKV